MLNRLRSGIPVALGDEVVDSAIAQPGRPVAAEPSGRKPERTSVWSAHLGVAGLALVMASAAAVLVMSGGDGSRARTPLRYVHRQLTFLGNADMAALSPDGESVAYRIYEGSVQRVVVRNIAGGDDREVTKFSRVSMEPAWSPDGSWLYVGGVQAGHSRPVSALLRVVDGRVSSAPGRVRWDPDSSRWITWTRNALVSIDRHSGDSTVIVSFGGDTLMQDPVWSLDGSWIAATATILDGSQVHWGIWTVSPAGEWNSVVEGDEKLSSPRWAADRVLYYPRWRGRVATVWRVRIGPDGRAREPHEPVIEPIPVRSGRVVLGAGVYSVSADGRRIAYTRDATTTNVWLVVFDSSGTVASREQLTTGSGWKGYPVFSPTDDRVAYISVIDDRTTLHLLDLRTHRARELLDLDRGAGPPAWSADGQRIAVGANGSIWIVDLDGGVARFSAHSLLAAPEVRWKPSGRVVYVHRRGNGLTEIDLGTRQRSELPAPGSDKPLHVPIFARDGRMAVWSWNPYGVYLFDDRDSTLSLLYDASGHVGGMIPVRWSSDGTEIFANDMTDVKAVSVERGSLRAVGTLPFPREAIGSPHVSSNGRMSVVAVQDPRSDVWLATVVTSRR